MALKSPVSITGKAREFIAKGHIQEGIDEISKILEGLSINEPFVYRTKNELLLLQARYARLVSEHLKRLIDYNEYTTQCNYISISIVGLLEGLDAEIMKTPPDQPLVGEGHLYKVELMLDMDFETATDEDIQSVLEKIARIIQTKPNELTIMAKRKGSIVLEMELSTETFVKLKLLTNIGVVKELKNVNITDAGGDGMYDKLLLMFLNGGGFSRFNLSGMDLRDADLNSSDFSGTNLSDTNLSGVNLSGAYLSGANLSRAYLRDANLSGTYLSGADLSDADLSGAVLSDSKLRDTNLKGANLRRANLSGADLRRANLSSANLSNADIRSAKLSSANLIGTKLTGANLSGANLSDTDLSGADLSVAKLSGADLSGASLSGADCTKTIFHVDQLELLQSMDVDISEAIFVDSDNGLNVESGAKAR